MLYTIYCTLLYCNVAVRSRCHRASRPPPSHKADNGGVQTGHLEHPLFPDFCPNLASDWIACQFQHVEAKNLAKFGGRH